MTSTPNPIRAAAELALALNLAPIPIGARSKIPAGGQAWPQKTYTLDDFPPDSNIGLHLKSATRLVDADLDSSYARTLAPRFLPDTTMKYGRPSKPVSHWMYRVDDLKPMKHTKFNGLPVVTGEKKETPTLLERRTGDGKQTVIPPSMHESGEAITYVDGCSLAPTQVSGKSLQLAFNRLAVASLIASVWDHGIRHDLALAVPAFMLKSGVSPDVVTEIMEAVVEEYSEGRGVADGLAALKNTLDRFENDPDSVTGAKVLIEKLPEARTFMQHVTAWLGMRMSRVESARAALAMAERGKPVVLIGDEQWSNLTDQAFGYLVAGNHEPTVGAATADAAPVLFQRGGELQRVRIDLESGRPMITPVGIGALRERLARVADWISHTGPEATPAQVPEFIASNILHSGSWPGIPPLKDVTETPVITATGEIVVTPGYQPTSRLWYHPTVATAVAPVSERPTLAEALAARDALLEVIVDFVFAPDGAAGSASRTHALAFLLLPFMRELIDGPTPMHLVDAPTPGSGKSLLADVVARIATGRAPRSFSWTKDGEEIRKTVTAFLVANAGGVIGVDNIAGSFASPVWAKILTDTVWTERLLGTSSISGHGSGVPVRATWYGTGNNVQMSNEAARRMLWIRLVPDCEHPEDRTGFTHDPLVPWVMAERGRLVHAALTLARFAFQAREAGHLPKVGHSWGSYESYNQLMGGLMALLDMKDWDGNRDALRESRDDELGPWRALIPAWAQAFGNQEVSGKELFEFAQDRSLLPEAFADQTLAMQSRLTAFGKALQQLVDRVVGGHRVARRTVRGVSRYRVRAV